jgi:hypothetical protein
VRRGASLAIPRCSRILRIASGFVIAAKIFMRPWHFGHVSASVMNTRLRRMAQGGRLILGSLVISISRDSPVTALREKHQQELSATRRSLLLAMRSFRHSRQSRWSPRLHREIFHLDSPQLTDE